MVLKLLVYLNPLQPETSLCSGLTSGPSGEWIEELTEKPQHVGVHVLSSTTALMSWTSPQENYNGTIVSVVSLTCQKQRRQRLEKQYCTQVRKERSVGLTHASCSPPRRRLLGRLRGKQPMLKILSGCTRFEP